MKFLLIVLAIHFIGELVSNKRKKDNIIETGEKDEMIRHPAEFEIR
jgi:hypothetical protein